MTPMKRAVSLAREAMGTTSPNPAVGAVLVKDGVVLGTGHTQPPGSHHAEIEALLMAGDSSRGATLYTCLLYTSPSPRDKRQSRMPSSA